MAGARNYRISEDRKKRILKLVDEGISYGEIGRILGMEASSVRTVALNLKKGKKHEENLKLGT